MADPEHVEVVKRGAAAIAEWRRENQDVVLDLIGADLSKADLIGADLTGADLAGSHFSGANLSGANLIGADLSKADLIGADLTGADLAGSHFSGANLSGANLIVADLSKADLIGADLTGAHLAGSHFSGANLSGANLLGAMFLRADLRDADLSGADLSGCDLLGVNFSGVNLRDAKISLTAFARCDLSRVSGLETVRHGAPSSVGTDTLLLTYEGAGNRLTADLRGFFIKAGVPASLLDVLPRIASEVRYHSAFIAYGEPDRAFAERIYGDLQGKGVSCWTYAMDATPGKPTWHEIGQKRREAGKFIVLCSFEGLDKAGPKKEIEDQMDDDPGQNHPRIAG